MWLRNVLRNTKIQYRMMWAFVLLTLIPMTITGVLTYMDSTEYSQEKIISYSVQLIDEASLRIQTELLHMESIVEEFDAMPDVQTGVLHLSEMEYTDYYTITDAITQQALQEMRKSTMGLSSDIMGIILVTEEGTILGSGQNNYTSEVLRPFYKSVLDQGKGASYSIIQDISGRYQLALSQLITSHETGEPICAMLVTFRENYIEDSLYSIYLSEASRIYLLDYDKRIVASNTEDSAGSMTVNSDEMHAVDLVMDQYHEQNSNQPAYYTDDHFLVVYGGIENADWVLVGLVPMDYIVEDSKDLMLQIMLIALLCMIAAIPVAIFVSSSISKPMKRLEKAMDLATAGNIEIAVEVDGNDELTHMSHSFNLMMTSIRELLEEVLETRKEIVFKLGEVIEARSKETSYHIRRVMGYVEIVAQGLGLPQKEVDRLKIASMLHDIGKVSIPDSILNKPGKLTDAEFALMKTHTTLGYELLKKTDKPIFIIAADIAHEHHERYDGNGYPRGLSGEKISLCARITALCDVFDALSTKRVYKEAWPLEAVVDYIVEQKGRQFDPEVVDVFLDQLDAVDRIRTTYRDEYKNDN